ncbi:MAG: hypothetical protein J0I09_08345 [Sphingobacteriia bacterium]|nr:hypothetical protein [Sphingobacteriia bacterium]
MSIFSYKPIKEFLVVFLYANVLNVLLYFLSVYFNTQRPLFLIEYNILLLLLVFRLPFVLYVLSFLLLFAFDLLVYQSSLFYFTPIEALQNLRYLKFHHSFGLIIISALLVAAFLGAMLYVVYKQYICKVSAMNFFVYCIIILALLTGSDVLNGTNTNMLNDKKFSRINICGSSVMFIYNLEKMYMVSDEKPKTFFQQGSAAQNFFVGTGVKADSSNKELIIIVESWGLLKQFPYVNFFKKYDSALTSNYKIHFDSTEFNGSTTNAELREFLNQLGAYNYYLNKHSCYADSSLFDKKAKQGYLTIGVHSFSKYMFKRNVWWKNIGIQNSYFKEELQRKGGITETDKDGAFSGVYDERAFDFLNKESAKYSKVFAYLLTVNTHLPYFRKDSLLQNTNTAFVKSVLEYNAIVRPQLIRVFNEVDYFITKIAKEKFWDKVLIVGDHAPPYISEQNRTFFNQQYVPYIQLSKK